MTEYDHEEEIVNMDEHGLVLNHHSKPHYLIIIKQRIIGAEDASIGDRVAFNTSHGGDIITEGEVV